MKPDSCTDLEDEKKTNLSGCCLHQLFSEQAARTPDAVALTWEGRSLTYRELDDVSSRLACNLRRRGVGPEVVVGIYLDRGFDLIVSILGILKAGGAYLPIDLSCPADRLAFMLQDASAPVLLTHRSFVSRAPKNVVAIVCLDDPDRMLAEENTLPGDTPTSSNLAYVIYTSGSTGRPKGVLITHQNVTRLFRSTEAWFGFGERDVWTLFHSCAFDFSVWEIWGALLYGGRLVIVPFVVSRSPDVFYDLLSRESVTVLNQTPSAFRQLCRVEEGFSKLKPLSLRWVIFGGEALEMSSLKPWFDRHGDHCPQLVNMYGITETTVHVTYRPLSMDDVHRGSVIGVPISDLELFVLNGDLKPASSGEPGELFVGGKGLARGYLNRPELTAERFIPSPFASGQRLYRTGDLARALPGGDIEYLGRIDQQVKIRGFRIELGEIEAALRICPGVTDAVVMAEEERAGDKRLFAYLVVRDGVRPATAELRRQLLAKMPEYMVPAGIVFVEEFPLTENGKLDRAALTKLRHLEKTVSPALALADNMQGRVLAVWTQILGHSAAGLDDNFFESGGNSLLLVQVHEMLQAEFKRVFPITILFAHPTVRSQAAWLNASESKIDTAAQERARRQREMFAQGRAAAR